MEKVSAQALAALRERGASEDELRAFADGDTMEAGQVILSLERPALTLRQAATSSGFDLEVVETIWRALGFPLPPEDLPVLGQREVDRALAIFGTAWQVLGREETVELARVLGVATARIADALVSTFHSQVGAPSLENDPTRLAFVNSVVMARVMLDALDDALCVLLRRQILAHMRPITPIQGSALERHETLSLTVGFVDLVGFTKTTESMTTHELHQLVTRFHSLSGDVVTQNDGHVVKTIGDAVMFVAPDALSACRAAQAIVDGLPKAGLPEARGGLECGEVLLHGGDYFGSAVNVASRLARMASPSAVLTTAAVRDAVLQNPAFPSSHLVFTRPEAHVVRGIAGPVDTTELRIS